MQACIAGSVSLARQGEGGGRTLLVPPKPCQKASRLVRSSSTGSPSSPCCRALKPLANRVARRVARLAGVLRRGGACTSSPKP